MMPNKRIESACVARLTRKSLRLLLAAHRWRWTISAGKKEHLRQLIFLFWLVIAPYAQAATPEDLCATTEAHKIKHTECHVQKAPFRIANEISTLEIATLLTGAKVDIDLIEPVYAYLIRLPDKSITRVALVPFLGDAHPVIEAKLGFQQFGVDRQLVYTSKVVEKFSDRYCGVYIAKHPFTGEYVDCGESTPLINTLSYASGMVSASDARLKVCAVVTAETSGKCGDNAGGVYSNKLVLADNGELVYVLMARLRVRARPELTEKTSYGSSTPVEYDIRYYEVKLNGEVTLRSKSLNLCSATCKPILDENKEVQQTVPEGAFEATRL